MENDFALVKAKFIENYNLARPIMTIIRHTITNYFFAFKA